MLMGAQSGMKVSLAQAELKNLGQIAPKKGEIDVKQEE
jgi:hypothetical protein